MNEHNVHLPAVIAESFGTSRSEARRAIAGGGVSIDGRTVPIDALDWNRDELAGRELRLGTRQRVRL